MYEIDSEEILRAQNNDKDAMTKIIKKNSGLIWSIVKRFLGRGYDKEELEQIAYIGFIKAIKGFDVSLDFKLSTYAVPYIIGEIKRFIRDDGAIKVSRSIKELSTKIGQVQREYLVKKGKEITIEELSKELNVEKEDIILALESQKSIESIDKNVYEDESGESKISKISNTDSLPYSLNTFNIGIGLFPIVFTLLFCSRSSLLPSSSIIFLCPGIGSSKLMRLYCCNILIKSKLFESVGSRV